MRYKKLGETELKVSEITTGTWGAGGRGWGDSDRNACVSALNTMADLGVNMIDTAPAYGDGSAEEIVGEVIRGRRDKFVISTKCGININAPRGQNRKMATRDEVNNGCEGSLRRLGTDYIDILFVHWPDPNTPVEETMEALNALKKQGKIRYIGLSNFEVPLMEEALKYAAVDVIQPPFSMIEQTARELMLWARKKNILSVAYASLGAGLLSGKIRAPVTFNEDDVRNGFYGRYFKEPGFSKVMELMKTVDKIAEARNVPQSHVAINWVTQKDFVLTALIGVRTDAHAKENCAAMDWSLSPEELTLLDAEVARLFGNIT
jgi:aryl-alcohol dehydrogenase-like predicted oxidoreductase